MDQVPYGARVAMEPVGYVVELRGCADDARSTVAQDSLESWNGDLATVEASFDGEVLELAVEARADVAVESCRVMLRHAFATDEQVLVNGYQSWTDAVERPAWARMRGLSAASEAIDRWALAGGGDSRFASYSGDPGELHGFTYATFRRDEGVVLVGSLDEDAGFTLISTNADRGQVVLETECLLSALKAGERRMLGRYAIARGTVDEVYDRWFELAGVEPRPVAPIVGCASWYRRYDAIDEKGLLADVESARAVFDAFDTDGATRLFQVDAGYCKVGDWLDVDREKFPNGLAPIAQSAREAGFVPGLWLAPFVCERGSRIAVEHPEWLLCDRAGEPLQVCPHWGGGFALNTRNPEVRSYVLEVLQTITEEWGFGLLKLDFLYAACYEVHGGMNRGELMADALELLRCGMGDNCLMLACGVPVASAFGRADYCRIGCDVGLAWDGGRYVKRLYQYFRSLRSERVKTENALANTYGRAPLDGRAFGNDPDVFFLHGDAKLTQLQRDALLFADADLSSALVTADSVESWTEGARAKFAQALSLLIGRKVGR